MAARLIELPWDSQPPDGGIVDQSSPFAVSLLDGYNGNLRRHAPGAMPTSAGLSQQAASLRPGPAVLRKASGSSSFIQLPSANFGGADRIQITLPLHITSQNSEMIMESSATADSNNGFYLFGLSSSSIRVQYHNGTSSSFRDASYTFPSRPCVATLRLSAASGDAKWELWVDGAVVAQDAFSLSGVFASTALNVGSRNAGSLSSDGAFGDVFIHRGWMDAGLLREWHAGLWRIYEPRRIFGAVAAAGGGATATVTGVGATSAAGVLTATGTATKTLTGATTTSSAGTVSASGSTNASATVAGVGATAAAGTLTATGAATGTLTGAGTTASAGTISATAGGSATATLTGGATSAAAGTLTATGAATGALTGAGATSAAGTVSAAAGGSAATTLTGSAITSAAGALTATGTATATLLGAGATASAGTVLASSGADAAATLTGAAVSASAGTLAAAGGSADLAALQAQVDALAALVAAQGQQITDLTTRYNQLRADIWWPDVTNAGKTKIETNNAAILAFVGGFLGEQVNNQRH